VQCPVELGRTTTSSWIDVHNVVLADTSINRRSSSATHVRQAPPLFSEAPPASTNVKVILFYFIFISSFNSDIRARRQLTMCIHDTCNKIRKFYVKLLKKIKHGMYKYINNNAILMLMLNVKN